MAQKLTHIDKTIYEKIARGDIEGLPQDLKLHLKYDRLSPGLREALALKAIEVFKSEYSKYGSLSRALIEVAKTITSLWIKVCREAESIAEAFKPIYIPPKMMVGVGPKAKYTNKPLYAEEVGCWIENVKPYTYITYWFKFPYDIWPGDGAEYEPWSIVVEENRVIEYQARTHWRIVHINPKIVLHIRGKPFIAFADHAHTPVPILDVDSVCSLLDVSVGELLEKPEHYISKLVDFTGRGKPISVEKLSTVSSAYSEFEDVVSMKKYVKCLCEGLLKFYSVEELVIEGEYSILVHVGPSRSNPPPHNPLKEKWITKPLLQT